MSGEFNIHKTCTQFLQKDYSTDIPKKSRWKQGNTRFESKKFLVTSTSCENGQHNNTLNKPFQKSNREGVISCVQNQVLLSKMQSIYAERRT